MPPRPSLPKLWMPKCEVEKKKCFKLQLGACQDMLKRYISMILSILGKKKYIDKHIVIDFLLYVSEQQSSYLSASFQLKLRRITTGGAVLGCSAAALSCLSGVDRQGWVKAQHRPSAQSGDQTRDKEDKQA